MGREQDWEEIEKANARYEQKIKEQFGGVDVLKLKKETQKSTQKIKQTNDKLKKIFKIIVILQIILVSFLIIFGTRLYIIYMKNTQDRVNVDVVANLKDIYGINAKIIGEDVDKSGNGKITLQSKGKEKITFIAMKNFGNYEFDYFDHCLKIAYERSDNDVKTVFEPVEKCTDTGMLDYSLNATASGLDGIENVVNKFIKLRDIAPDYYDYSWKVNIQADGFSDKINSFGLKESEAAICRREQCEYVIFCVDSGKTEKLTNQEIQRYYKKFALKAYLNGNPICTEMMDEQVQRTILYNYEYEEYDIPIECFEELAGVEIKYTPNRIPTEITYKGKTYKVEGENIDLQNNVIPPTVGTSTLEEIFGARFETDMRNKTMNIIVR